MAVTNLTGTKWLLEQGWTATSGFGQFDVQGLIYDTNDSLDANSIGFFNIGYRVQDWTPTPYSNNIYANSYPTFLTPTYYYEFEFTGGSDVTNTTLVNWLETNATLVYQPTPSIADKLQDLIDIKQDIKVAIENKDVDLTGVDFGGYAGKIDEIETGGAPQSETWVINETGDFAPPFIQTLINFISGSENFGLFDFSLDKDDEVTVINYRRNPNSEFSAIKVYNDGVWVDQIYRTITFETAPTGDLLTWLEANAVRIDALHAVVELTQAQYDALPVYDNNTYYLIVEE